MVTRKDGDEKITTMKGLYKELDNLRDYMADVRREIDLFTDIVDTERSLENMVELLQAGGVCYLFCPPLVECIDEMFKASDPERDLEEVQQEIEVAITQAMIGGKVEQGSFLKKKTPLEGAAYIGGVLRVHMEEHAHPNDRQFVTSYLTSIVTETLNHVYWEDRISNRADDLREAKEEDDGD